MKNQIENQDHPKLEIWYMKFPKNTKVLDIKNFLDKSFNEQDFALEHPLFVEAGEFFYKPFFSFSLFLSKKIQPQSGKFYIYRDKSDIDKNKELIDATDAVSGDDFAEFNKIFKNCYRYYHNDNDPYSYELQMRELIRIPIAKTTDTVKEATKILQELKDRTIRLAECTNDEKNEKKNTNRSNVVRNSIIN